ncbi:molybdenum ABC transporter ATP-binding protein [Oceanicoccus sp. KOV_DT_Chl]|uniref:molybdenum ABC transporter ATP-binding protein n=1 Tax=Oceanicoccus sp. KOV_DT_Chl TaxID=1904639 RepID=UPI000C7ADBA7|nr:molybdenum ABC transporter ATP-binding protein [Oceanicoccus sp. KOV_DT_Chl]
MSLIAKLELNRRDFSLTIDTTIETTGITAIYGHSGAGKTTLLRWLAGLEPNSPGQLQFNDQYWQHGDHFLPTQQRQIAYVFQDARLFPHLTVQGNLDFAYQRRFNNNGPTMAQVSEWFELSELLAKNSTELSGGEQQRVAIARALLSSPQLLLMDEPLASLDSKNKAVILQHLQRLHQQLPTPTLYVSHNIEEVSRLADQLILIEKGQITAQGPLLDLCSRLDLSLSHEENAASIIMATVQQHDNHYQLTELLIDDTLPLFLTQMHATIGDAVAVRIPARDVSITLEKPDQTSILNIIPATVDDIEQSAAARVLIRLKVSEQFLLVRLTHKSVDRLQLTIGQTVYAQIKTVALLSENPSL